jgi:hypothetical protein
MLSAAKTGLYSPPHYAHGEGVLIGIDGGTGAKR